MANEIKDVSEDKAEDRTVIYFSANGSKEQPQEFTLDGELSNSGRTKVIRVLDPDHKTYVLKVFLEPTLQKGKRTLQKPFADDVESLNEFKDNPYFVPLQAQGTITYDSVETETGKKNNHLFPAVLFPYEGSSVLDVDKVLDKLLDEEKISPEAVQAFHTKVYLSTCLGIVKAHEDNRYHGDLARWNILCGFDINEFLQEGKIYEDKISDLEERLIFDPVRLIDPTRHQELTSTTNGSLTSQFGAENVHMKLYSPSPSEQSDVIAIIQLYSILLEEGISGEQRFRVRPDYVIKKITGDAPDPDTAVLACPSPSTVLEKMIQRIQTEGYFTLERNDPKGIMQVLRPVDAFSLQWKDDKPLLSVEQLKKCYETDDQRSYLPLLKREQNTGLQKQLNEQLNLVIKNSLDGLTRQLEDFKDKRKPLHKDKQKYFKQQSELQSDKNAVEDILELQKGKIQEKTKALQKDDDNEELAKELPILAKGIKEHNRKREECIASIATLDANISEVEKKLGQLQYLPFVEALTYIFNKGDEGKALWFHLEETVQKQAQAALNQWQGIVAAEKE